MTDFKNTGLFDFDQENRFVFDLGFHSSSHRDFDDAFSDLLHAHGELDVDLRLLLACQYGGGIGLLQRHVLEIDALNLKHGSLLFV